MAEIPATTLPFLSNSYRFPTASPVSSSSSSSVGGRGGGRKVKSIDGDMNEHMRQLRGWLGRILDHSKENIQPESSLLDHHLIDSDDGCLTVGGGVICPSQLLQVLH
uniref:Expressed conserved protein n=1 Tax=Echinococcus granulosus TaxID=6210 RepID=A0A068WXF3_ECHGR|nr:hypothetical protein EgrG_002029400 [Echinococcus granulosus]